MKVGSLTIPLVGRMENRPGLLRAIVGSREPVKALADIQIQKPSSGYAH